MEKQNSIKLFEEKKVRSKWNEEEEEWYFSVVDVMYPFRYPHLLALN